MKRSAMKKWALTLTSLSLALFLAGLVWSSSSQAAEEFTLNIACTQPAGDENPTGYGLFLLGQEVEKRSGGRIKSNFMGASQLGSGRKVLELVQNNVVQVCDDSMASMEVFSTKFAPLSMPFLFPNREVAFKFADGEFMQTLVDGVEADSGLRVMGFFENGSRNFTNSSREIKTPDDLKGLKMRVMQSPLFIKIMEALGAVPVPIAYAELFTALQQKVVDGQENPISVIRSGKLYEVQKYLTLSGHVFDYLIISVNPEWFKSLPPDLQKVFVESMDFAAKANRKRAAELEGASIEFLKKYLTVTELSPEQRQAFKDKLQKPMQTWLAEKYPAEKENMVKILAEVEKISAQK